MKEGEECVTVEVQEAPTKKGEERENIDKENMSNACSNSISGSSTNNNPEIQEKLKNPL